MLKYQRGSLLIESMISVLLFLVGLLALMKMASISVNQVSQTKYRNDASNLASEVVASMYSTWDGSNVFDHSAWDARVKAALPDGKVDNFTVNNTRVDITISWADKNSDGRSNYVSTTEVILK